MDRDKIIEIITDIFNKTPMGQWVSFFENNEHPEFSYLKYLLKDLFPNHVEVISNAQWDRLYTVAQALAKDREGLFHHEPFKKINKPYINLHKVHMLDFTFAKEKQGIKSWMQIDAFEKGLPLYYKARYTKERHKKALALSLTRHLDSDLPVTDDDEEFTKI